MYRNRYRRPPGRRNSAQVSGVSTVFALGETGPARGLRDCQS
ncbi:hypothetical protein I549_5257 [Mycobacterium avium subsp. avium 2285 (R)]|uniref:Uncharacterized protein n=1 Tax=Mycobacterium avium (strain 104) TaxID=243243 RepID=A0A0H3A1R3_MYCA1|nr:hypothetical protein MAV_1315 [Mycobacterium avium 104]ETZ46274.1 hypothetical protein L837_2791 [Mycobacterium avium MAV_061107_1842]EUA39029.1 hypothetical protein I549_5257 [Mycobacterium avium subsp. avium 2285 (R)]